MKKIALVVEKYYAKNRIFDLSNAKINRDDCMYPWRALKIRMAGMGIDLSTSDINLPEASDIVIYNDMPTVLPEEADAQKSVLLAWESPLIKPRNFDQSLHSLFARIYTYDDRLVDGKKYFKLFYVQKIPEKIDFSKEPLPDKLMCLIAGNKTSTHPLELYSERLKTIKWFESNHPGDLDLFGFGWNERVFRGPKIVRALNRISIARKAFVMDKRTSYRGLAHDKRTVFGRYRFALCYENIRDIPGYITEKLLDAMIAGCVPVYWGAPNVADYVPEDCFIDRRRFIDEDSLFGFLASMDAPTHARYRERIQAFMLGEGAKHFSAESFVEMMAKMVNDMDANAVTGIAR